MYNLGKMFGYVHLYIGEEAVAAGFIKLLTQRDAVVSTYRDHVHALCKGVTPRPLMAELFGWTTGLCRGQGGSMHMFYRPCNFLGGFGFIGEGIPIATGAGLMPSIAVRYSRNRAPRTSTWPSSSLAMGTATSASSSSA